MIPTFDNLSPNLLNQLAQLIQKIPEKILSYGYRTSSYQDWSRFKEDTGYQKTITTIEDIAV